jgi:isopentenyldiphosphate isomerase
MSAVVKVLFCYDEVMEDELLDLVNRSDEVIGTINRKDYNKIITDKLGYIRAADLFILNSEGNIYVPTRTADKTIAPNGFDFSVGGHVGSGESYLSTIIREASEELNLLLEPEYLMLIDKTVQEEIKYIRYLYLYRSDDTPIYNPEDFVSAEWMSPAELIKQIDNGHLAKISLKPSIALLTQYLQTA